MSKHHLIIIFLYFLAYSSQGQDLNFYRPIGDISQNSVTSIVQDQKGFLWFGTKHGLNRYNGVSFQYFLHNNNDSLGLSNSSVESLLVDRDGDIWIGTLGGGLNLYSVEKQSFVKLNPLLKNELKNDIVLDIFEDLDGDIWIGTESSGVKVWNKESATFQNFYFEANQKNKLPSNHIPKIEQDNLGMIWIATWGKGLCRFDKERKELTIWNEASGSNINNDIVKYIHKGKNKLWVGTHQGIQYLEHDQNKVKLINLEFKDEKFGQQINSFDIISILEDSNDRLWIGTENNGLLIYYLKTKAVEQYKYNPKGTNNIQNNSIWKLFEDKHGTIWIGLFKNGINKIDPFEQKFNHISDGPESKLNLSYGLVSSFAEDQQGNLWVATDGGGLNFIDRSQTELAIQNIIPKDQNGLTSKEIVCIVSDEWDRLWIGTWGEGVFLKDQNNKFKSYLHDPGNYNSLSGNNIMSLFQDSKNNIWIATHRIGLDLFVPSENRFYHFLPSDTVTNYSISGNKISTIVEDQNGKLWVGMEGKGIDRFELNENREIINLKNYQNNPENNSSLSSNIINNIFVDSKNRIWVATDGGGINILNNENENENFRIINKEDGLPSDVIYGILEENPDLFWVSTNAGLASINLEINEIKTFDLEDGLQAKEFNKNAAFKTKDQTFLFGGINGFNYFKPKDIQTNNFLPAVFITNIEVHNEEKNIDFHQKLKTQLLEENIILESDENNLKIFFSALNYSQATKNQYTYKLENYDTYWKGGQNITFASYSNIPPGKYIFKVKASNNDQAWNETPTTINIQIKAPWHKTSWAYAAYTLFILGLLLFINRTLIQRERLKNELKVEHLERERMQALGETRSQFFANISHEFKTPLTLIISPLKAMQKKLVKKENKNQVNVMLSNAERLLRLINQILDLSKLESGVTKLKTTKFDIVDFVENIANNFHPYSKEQFISFQLDLPEQPIPLYFEKDKMEKILINLLSNAFKYTPEYGKIKLGVTQEEDQVIISIVDSGIGISKDQINQIFDRFYQAKNHTETKNSGTGIGLSLTKQLVTLHGGKIEVASKEGEGTQFKVKFPIGKSHLSPHQIESEYSPHIISEDTRIELKDFNISTSEPSEKIVQEDSDLPLILIIEDNPDLRSFTKTYLQTNYRIIEAENGQQGLELAKQHIPDLIITDLRMPIMNGFELCEQIRSHEMTCHILIIMLTVKSSEESKKRGYEYGANYYLTKPFNPNLLNIRIKNILDSRDKYKTQLISQVKNIPSPQVVEPSSEDEKIVSKDEIFIEKIEGIILQNIEDSTFSIEDLCREIGISKSQLYRKMKGLFGQSANEFIRTIRLKKAAELMQSNQELSISEITYKVGFNDLQYFRRCFKKQYGKTPSDFIKN
ncbi:MAG: two-component regulator propeller domain-containing protein [Saprospiraceae bacterium]